MASTRYFIREQVAKITFRDERGRFVSREDAIRKGILPVETVVTQYRDRTGKLVSEDKVKRSKRKIVNVVRDKNGQMIGKDLKIQGRTIPSPVFGDILGQQMLGKLSEAINNGDRIGFIYKGRFYPVAPTMIGKIQDAWLRLSKLAVSVYKDGDSLYYTVPIAEGPDSLVMDFDGVIPSEMTKDDPDYMKLRNIFYRKADVLLKSFLT